MKVNTPAAAHEATVAKASPPHRLGLRERNKQDKLRRIKGAARGLFLEKGFDETTTREIAERASVGLGTLFSYAANKRDLLFLIFTDELEKVSESAFQEVPSRLPFVEQLITVFRRYYEFFGRQPGLSRLVLRELTFYLSGTEAQRFQEHRRRVLGRLASLVRKMQAEGRGTDAQDSGTIAHLLFTIYAGEVRRWLSEDSPKVEPGLASLRRLFRLAFSGLSGDRRAS